jgi:muconolactone delta-isomerase
MEESVRILAIERTVDGVADNQFTSDIAAAEARRAWGLAQAGVIRELYLHADEATAILVLKCQDLAEADADPASLPMVTAGLIEFEVLPLRAHSGFERLFGSTSAQ